MGKQREIQHSERFDPDEGTGKLIDSEHRGRYHWAAQVVAGKEVLDAACGVGYGIEILARGGAAAVTGLDLDPAAVSAARERFGEHAAAILEGDLQQLPLDDDSFDVVVCFEAIEHVEDASRVLAEMRRVLRPDGVAIISTPNPNAYVTGNEFHVHELRPDELTSAVGEHFANVARYRQDAWLASTIESAAVENGTGGTESRQVLRTAPQTDDPDYSLVVAGDGGLPAIEPILASGDTFDVHWWTEQLANRKGELAQALEREALAVRRLEEATAALLEANQELAQIPVLHHRLQSLGELHAELSEAYQGLVSSTSWRITAPLRRFRRR